MHITSLNTSRVKNCLKKALINLIINILQIMNIIYTVRLIRSGGVWFDSTYQWHADMADGPKIDNVDVTVACQIITCTVEIVTTGGRIVFLMFFWFAFPT